MSVSTFSEAVVTPVPGGYVLEEAAYVGGFDSVCESKTAERAFSGPPCGNNGAAVTECGGVFDPIVDEKNDVAAGRAGAKTPSHPKFVEGDASVMTGSSCSVSSASPAEDVQELVRPALVVIDNDECIGSWGDLSMLFTVFTHVLHIEPPVDLFARLLNDTGCARPGLRELYDTVLDMKAEGSVCGVYMCTAARDTVGWVTFLRKVLEVWYGKPVYDGVIEGSMIHEWHMANGSAPTDMYGSVYKNMHQVRTVAGVAADTPVIAIDDRPDNILHGEAIRVVPYSVAVNLVEVARLFVPQWNVTLEQRYGHTLQESWRTYQRNPARYTVAWMDVAMSTAARIVREKVNAVAYRSLSSSPASCDRNVPMCDDAKESL
jgi:hypothetical protein